MTIALRDRDCLLWCGDVREGLALLAPGSVDCVVTSPPYYGLRDYGTAEWVGGDPECNHRRTDDVSSARRASTLGPNRDGRGVTRNQEEAQRSRSGFGVWCPKCGARRDDHQIGLEATPEQFLAELVEVFRLVRRALSDTGTCWVNMGDTYATSGARTTGRNDDGRQNVDGFTGGPKGGGKRTTVDNAAHAGDIHHAAGHKDAFRNSARYTGQQRDIRSDVPAKNLLGMPWRLALALQASGWVLRRDVIWHKPNPMPESVTDRCSTAHEYVFHLTKRQRYWYDWRACPEAIDPEWLEKWHAVTPQPLVANPDSPYRSQAGALYSGGIGYTGNDVRNMRSVWTIATDPTPDAHFATFPRELVRRCVLLSCPEQVCRKCGKPRERVIDTEYVPHGASAKSGGDYAGERSQGDLSHGRFRPQEMPHGRATRVDTTTGWTDCGCDAGWRPGVVLDPFVGSGTTCKVARDQGRRSIGIDLNSAYLDIAKRRLAQLSLLAEVST